MDDELTCLCCGAEWLVFGPEAVSACRCDSQPLCGRCYKCQEHCRCVAPRWAEGGDYGRFSRASLRIGEELRGQADRAAWRGFLGMDWRMKKPGG